MADNIPDPSQDPNLTPFSTSTTDPSGQTRTLTGYGTRRPIQPPGGMGGIGMPDLGPGIAAAYRELPVDQAEKAVEAAIRYQGQRGYQRDLASGKSSAEAFARWAPMIFRTATGLPEAINRTSPAPPPAITPQQQIQNALNQKKFELSQQESQRKATPKPVKVAAPKLSTLDKIDETRDKKELGLIEDQLASTKEKEPGWFTSGNHKQIAALHDKASQIRKRIASRYEPEPPQPVAPVAAPVAPNPAMAVPTPAAPVPGPQGKVLTRDIAKTFLEHADGDKEKARKLARDAGYQF